MDILKKGCKSNKISRRLFFTLLAYSSVKILNAKENCTKTPLQPLGPFYKHENLKFNTDMTNKKKAKGKYIRIYGNIINKKCKPNSDSIIKIWQANAFGKYNHQNDLSHNKKDINFSGYTKLKTNKDGYFEFITVIPGAYKISKNIYRPPHIHLLVKTSDNLTLITQLYFKNHPLNYSDFIFNKVKHKSLLELVLNRAVNGMQSAQIKIII